MPDLPIWLIGLVLLVLVILVVMSMTMRMPENFYANQAERQRLLKRRFEMIDEAREEAILQQEMALKAAEEEKKGRRVR